MITILREKNITTFSDIKKIQNKFKNKKYNYDWIGIRVVDKDYYEYHSKKGSILLPSHKWIDGEYTEEELNGTSAININSRIEGSDYSGYLGTRIFILGSDFATYGEDVGEIIMEKPIILDIINL